jgi:hypothetical protein
LGGQKPLSPYELEWRNQLLRSLLMILKVSQ